MYVKSINCFCKYFILFSNNVKIENRKQLKKCPNKKYAVIESVNFFLSVIL